MQLRTGKLGKMDVLDGVESLLSKSLLQQKGRARRRAALLDAGDDTRVRKGEARGEWGSERRCEREHALYFRAGRGGGTAP